MGCRKGTPDYVKLTLFFLLAVLYGNNWSTSDINLINLFFTNVGRTPWFSVLFSYQVLVNGYTGIGLQGTARITSTSMIVNSVDTSWIDVTTSSTIYSTYGYNLNYLTNDPVNILYKVIMANPTDWQPTTVSGGISNCYFVLVSDDISIYNINGVSGPNGVLGVGIDGWVSKSGGLAVLF